MPMILQRRGKGRGKVNASLKEGKKILSTNKPLL